MKLLVLVAMIALGAAACGKSKQASTTPAGATGGSSYGGAMGSGSAMPTSHGGGDPCGG